MTALVSLLRRNLEVLPGLFLLFLLVAPYWFSLPVWDGQAFVECVRGAAHETFQWQNFLCYAHPTLFFVTLFAIPEYYFPGSVFLMHTLMFVLGAASVLAFSALCRLFFPTASRLFRSLCVMLFALQPVIVSNLIDYNFDSGVTIFFVILLALLLHGHEKWAVLVGIMMVFTKESGVMLYGLTLIGFWMFSVRTAHHFLPAALKAGLRRFWLLLPLFLYGFHELLQHHLGNTLLHDDTAPGALLHAMLSIDLLHERFLTFLTEILLFQFTWFQTAITLCGLLLWFWQRDIGRKSTKHAASVGFIAFLYLTGIYSLTRYVPYNNVRYLMPLFPLGILLFSESALAIGRKGKVSVALLMVAVILSGVSMFRSVDPVSAELLGTFLFGSHQMYALGTKDDCCLMGRDQLAYNLEYRKLFTLQDRAFQRIRPGSGTIIAFPPDAYRSHRDPIDPVTFRRTWSPTGFFPVYLLIDDIPMMDTPPKEFSFIDFPNLPDDAAKAAVEERYDIAISERISDGGYSIGLIRYVLKPETSRSSAKKP